MSKKEPLRSGSDEDYAIKGRIQRALDKCKDSYEREEVYQKFSDELDERYPDDEQAKFIKNNYLYH